jgi:hypothetical protein
MAEIPSETLAKLAAIKLSSRQMSRVVEILGELLAPRGKGRALEETWSPSQKDIDYGLGMGLTAERIRVLAEEMRQWASANKNRAIAKKANWSSTFKGWMLREVGKSQRFNGTRDHGNSYREIADELRSRGNGQQRVGATPDFFNDADPEHFDR